MSKRQVKLSAQERIHKDACYGILNWKEIWEEFDKLTDDSTGWDDQCKQLRKLLKSCGIDIDYEDWRTMMRRFDRYCALGSYPPEWVYQRAWLEQAIEKSSWGHHTLG
jgi:hypothetical protein